MLYAEKARKDKAIDTASSGRERNNNLPIVASSRMVSLIKESVQMRYGITVMFILSQNNVWSFLMLAGIAVPVWMAINTQNNQNAETAAAMANARLIFRHRLVPTTIKPYAIVTMDALRKRASIACTIAQL